MNLCIKEVADSYITICWDAVEGAECYKVYWSDKEGADFLEIGVVAGC